MGNDTRDSFLFQALCGTCSIGARCPAGPSRGHASGHRRSYSWAYAPQGVNAVEAAAEAIAFLKRMARRYRDHGPYDRGFDIAHTTVHTGVIRGGSALNIVPNECIFDFEFRNLPGDDPQAMYAEFTHFVAESIEPEMRAVDPACGFSIAPLSAMPALGNAPEAAVVGLAQELSGHHDFGKVSFGTEAAHFQRRGIAAVVCGPGSIAQAHKRLLVLSRWPDDPEAALDRFARVA